MSDHSPFTGSLPPVKRGRRLRILLVEDDTLVQQHVVRLLEQMGHVVHASENTQSAISLLCLEQPFDLLFTDIVMPGPMNGIDLADYVMNFEADIQVLLTSGYARRDILENLDDPASPPLLAKPYRLQQLRDRLVELFGYSDADPSCPSEDTDV